MLQAGANTEFDDKMLSNHTMGQKFHRLGHPGNTGDGVRQKDPHGSGSRCRPLAAHECSFLPIGTRCSGLEDSSADQHACSISHLC